MCRVENTPVGVDRDALRLLRAHEAVRGCWAFLPSVTAVRAAGQQVASASSIGPLVEEFDTFVDRREGEQVYTPADATAFREKGRTHLTDAMRVAHQSMLPSPDGDDGNAATVEISEIGGIGRTGGIGGNG